MSQIKSIKDTIKDISDKDLVEMVKCFDQLNSPTENRFDGDTNTLEEFYAGLKTAGSSQLGVAGLILISPYILREVISRNIKVD